MKLTLKVATKIALVFALSLPALAQVSVKGYTRQDGTVVAGYTRRSPHSTGGPRSDTKLYNSPQQSTSSLAPNPRRAKKQATTDAKNCVLVYGSYIVCGGQLVSQYATQTAAIPRDSRGRILRSGNTKKVFQSLKPCPTTHSTTGRCPGYIMDHINPLVCGGPDTPDNLQWQTIAEAKAKDKWERRCGK